MSSVSSTSAYAQIQRGKPRYYSYGASLEPTYWSIFRPSHAIIEHLEHAPNDGLVRYVVKRLAK